MTQIQSSRVIQQAQAAPQGARPAAAAAAPAAVATPAMAQDQLKVDGGDEGLVPATPLSFAGPMSKNSQTLFEGIGAGKIAELANHTLTGGSVEGYDPTKGAGPMDFALTRVMMVLGNGNAAEKEQLANFKAALTKLAAGGQPTEAEGEALRLFGIGYVSDGGQNFIGGITMSKTVDASGRTTYSTLTEQLLSEDFAMALGAISELESIRKSSPAAFVATAKVLRKNEEILVLYDKASTELKSADELNGQAKAQVAEVAVLQHQSAAVAQEIEQKQAQNAAKGQALSEALATQPPSAQAGPVSDIPAPGSELIALVDPSLAQVVKPDLIQALTAAGVAPDVVTSLVNEPGTRLSPEIAALVTEIVAGHTETQALQNKKSALDLQIESNNRRIDDLLERSRQLQLKGESMLASAQTATQDRKQLEHEAQAIYAASNPDDIEKLRRRVAPVLYTTDEGYGRNLNRIAAETRAETADIAQAAAWQRGAGDPRRPKAAAPKGPTPARPASTVDRAAGVAKSCHPAEMALGVARQDAGLALSLSDTRESLFAARRSRELNQRIEARQLSELLDRRRQEADRQAARREFLDWQAYREIQRANAG